MYNKTMPPSDAQHVTTWEHRQAELWDRIFQVTQDVIVLADSLESTTGSKQVQEELVKTALQVGRHLVRANAAEQAPEFAEHLKEARLKAVETDYWLRLTYILQQREEVQRDLSSIITQYTSIVDLLQKFSHHIAHERDVIRKHTKGPRITG